MKTFNKHIKKREFFVCSNVRQQINQPENKKTKKSEKMTNEGLAEIEKLASEMTPEQTTKKIKRDKGLIERVESQKMMITEDNKQLLND